MSSARCSAAASRATCDHLRRGFVMPHACRRYTSERRDMPSCSAAMDWLPPHASSTASTRVRSASSPADAAGAGGASCASASSITATPMRLVSLKHDGAIDHVAQLAHVTGPRVLHQPSERGCIEGEPAVTREQLCGDPWKLLAALAQRRDRDREAGEPVNTGRRATRPLRSARPDCDGRRDEAHVDELRSQCADALGLPCLEHAQQLDLYVRIGLADLVEEHRAAVGALDQTGLVLDRTGERTALVTEQLALEHGAQSAPRS